MLYCSQCRDKAALVSQTPFLHQEHETCEGLQICLTQRSSLLRAAFNADHERSCVALQKTPRRRGAIYKTSRRETRLLEQLCGIAWLSKCLLRLCTKNVQTLCFTLKVGQFGKFGHGSNLLPCHVVTLHLS